MKYYLQKKVLIIGGTQGIGHSMACYLSKFGANISVVARNTQRLDATIEDLKKYGTNDSQTFFGISLDVTDEKKVQEVLSAHMEAHGTPDILINCAGYSHPGYFLDTPTDAMKNMMNLNYFGTVNVLKVILPKMIKRGSGQVANTSSMAGFLGLFGYSAYCASKFAVVGLSESLKRELKPNGISVSVICPPGTQTPGFDEENKIKPPEVLAMEKSAKVLTADEVALNSLKQLQKKKYMILPSFDGKLAFQLNRFLPMAIEQAVKRTSKSFPSSRGTASQQ